MIPINNSDTAWLIVSDYNQDDNIPFNDLREDIVDPDIDRWHWAWNTYSSIIGGVEYMIEMNDEVGCGLNYQVGGIGYGQTMHLAGSQIVLGNRVGGHDPDQQFGHGMAYCS